MDIKSFKSALAQIAEARGITPEKIIETIEAALATAYKKDYGEKGQKIKAKFDPNTGDAKFWQIKLVVDESMLYTPEEVEEMKEKKITVYEDFDKIQKVNQETEQVEEIKKIVFNPEKHIMLLDAKKDYPSIELAQEIEIPLKQQEGYGRIAAQTAKQVILQKIREAEKETIASEYKSKEGEMASGLVQRVEGSIAYVDIGKTLGLLQRDEQIPGEFYKPGQRIKCYILKVEDSPKGSVVILSRAYPKLISRLFEIEVPEVASGAVVIKSIAREAGFRTKIAVSSTQEGIDPVGSMVGQRGTRIMAVINEIGGEKIDVIEWKDDPKKFIAAALSPAKVGKVEISENNSAVVEVPQDQLSLAIGKDGRNVRLSANLTGWKIDIKPAPKEEESEETEASGKNVEETKEPAQSPADVEAGKKPAKEKKAKKAKKAKKDDSEEKSE